MPRMTPPATIDQAPESARAQLTELERAFGRVPNLFQMMSLAPAALEGYAKFNGALARGALDPATRERIALAIAEYNGCAYCLAAHSTIAQTAAGLTGTEIASNRKGGSTDVKADAAVRFALAIAKNRGRIEEALFDELVTVGYSAAEIIEIIAHVALNNFTNFINEALGTEIDFPEAARLAA